MKGILEFLSWETIILFYKRCRRIMFMRQQVCVVRVDLMARVDPSDGQTYLYVVLLDAL